MSGNGRTREQRLSKERMEDVSTGDGFVYDASGRKLRKPRLSKEEIPDQDQAAANAPTAESNAASVPALSFLVASVITMLAFKKEWPAKLGLSGEGRVPPEYAAPAIGFAAALLLQQYFAFAQRRLVVD